MPRRPTPPILAALALLLAALTGCPATDDGPCAPLDDLDSGQLRATVDGDSWAVDDGSWFWAADDIQAITSTTDGWRLSMLARLTVDGTPIRDAIDADAFPLEVPLAEGIDGGWAILYPASGPSFASERAAGGTLHITALDDGDELWGCFAFDGSDGDTTVSITDARLRFPFVQP